MTRVTPRAIAYAAVQVCNVFDAIYCLTISVACSCTLRCTNLVHWTQRHELPWDVWHHHWLFPGCSKSNEEEAASAAACMVEPVRCDLVSIKYRYWQLHHLVRYFLKWRLENLSTWGPIHLNSSTALERDCILFHGEGNQPKGNFGITTSVIAVK